MVLQAPDVPDVLELPPVAVVLPPLELVLPPLELVLPPLELVLPPLAVVLPPLGVPALPPAPALGEPPFDEPPVAAPPVPPPVPEELLHPTTNPWAVSAATPSTINLFMVFPFVGCEVALFMSFSDMVFQLRYCNFRRSTRPNTGNQDDRPLTRLPAVGSRLFGPVPCAHATIIR